MSLEEHTIDAADNTLGRVSSRAARLLLGKHRPDYAPHTVAPVQVTVINARKLRISPNQLRDKVYLSYSGYPGGQKVRTMAKMIEKKGYREVVRRAVYGMLPANRLRARLMKQLVIEE